MNSVSQTHIPSILSPTVHRSETWHLGQIMQGRVTGNYRTDPTVNIGGSNYRVTSNLQFSQGEPLLLRVSELSPRIEFSIVSRSRDNIGIHAATTVFLSDKLLQGAALPNRGINASLSNLIGLLHTSSTFPLPPSTAMLIESMRNKLIRPEGLTNPDRLERSLLSGGLLVGRFVGGQTPNGGLLNLLRQIANSLESEKHLSSRLPLGVKYQQALGMSLYLSGELNFLKNLAREVDEQYSKLLLLRNGSRDELEQHAYRLFAELPVLAKNHVKSISLRFLKKRPGGRKESETVDCSVEFEFEFDSGRLYTKILILESSVRFTIDCEISTTAELLRTSEESLAQRLDHYGLRLDELGVSVLGKQFLSEVDSSDTIVLPNESQKGGAAQVASPRTEEATRAQLREAVADGMMPELEEFALQIDSRNVQTSKEIPTHLYCAMACLFAQLFESENERGSFP